ncbi:MAG: S8 family serine peptidase, partial [Candidatus Thorarchaeota archaeon]
MNNLRKTAVLLFVGVFTISLIMVPFTPMATLDSQVAAPTNYEDALVEKYSDILENDLLSEKMDPMLVSYMDTGVLDQSVVTTREGDIKILLFVEPTFESSSLANIAKVTWQMDLKLARVASVEVSSVAGIKQLEAMAGIKYVMADRFIDREVINDPSDPVVDMFNINDVVGATGTYASGYDGTGVIVGVDDTGIDFSQTDMQGTEYHDGSGIAQSYDPNGYGFTEMYIANRTAVSNVTEWLAAGNLLTYQSGGLWYLNTTGWDPVCNNEGGHRSLMGLRPPFGNGYPEGGNVGFIGLYEWAWGINNGTEFVYNEMWKDWQIPAPGAENYTFGWSFQQRRSGYAKTFAAAMYYEGDIVIDYNSSLAWTQMWNDAFYYETIDLNVTAERDAAKMYMDWSFVDDISEGFVNNMVDNILYADGLHDGTGTFGIGSLSWAFDDLGYLATDYGLFAGITSDGMVWNALFNGESNHGHWTGAAIASQGVADHDVYENGTMKQLPGVAPGAKIIAAKGITSGGGLMADFWAAGFHLNTSAGPHGNETYWTYAAGGPGEDHKAHIVSNSWGWGPGAGYLQIRLYTMVYDIASAPGVMATGYPGTLFVFSAGNDGNDYGTGGTPSSAFSVVSVGATYTSHYYAGLYSPVEQTDGQAVHFSSSGPGFTGLVKPDVMAPGYRGANPNPSQAEWGGYGDTFAWWQGTSLSCPIAAGVAALIMDAWNVANGAMPTPQMTKDILLSSATNLGYDPFIQGNGLVNAEAAIAAIETGAADSYFFESDSFQYYSDQIADAWAYWIPDWAPFGGIYYDADWDTPVGLETTNMFFGTVQRNDVRVVNLNVSTYGLAYGDTANFDVITPWYYTELSKVSQAYTSYAYNDTNFSPLIERPGTFVLDNLMNLVDFYASNYATVTVTYDVADIGDYPVVRLFDWDDTIANGDLNYWNFTTGVGDHIDHVARYTSQCNEMTMRLADTGTLANLFDFEPTLQFDGPAGIDFTVTIQAWQKTADTAIGVADGTTGMDVTLTVPSGAEYGAHEGMLYLEDTSSGFTHEVPYSYTVEMDLDGAMGATHTLVDGPGAETTPFDTGAVTTSFTYGTDRTDEGGGLTTFHFNVPYNIAYNASYLVMRAMWQNYGTVVDMNLRSETGSELMATDDGGRPFDPAPTGDKTNTIIYDPGGLINGTYWFYYSVHVINGSAVPEPITIELQLYGENDLGAATNVFNWTARDMTTPTTISASDVLTGDHVTIENTWTIPAVAGLPEY